MHIDLLGNTNAESPGFGPSIPLPAGGAFRRKLTSLLGVSFPLP